jgi:hypothetical protein
LCKLSSQIRFRALDLRYSGAFQRKRRKRLKESSSASILERQLSQTIRHKATTIAFSTTTTWMNQFSLLMPGNASFPAASHTDQVKTLIEYDHTYYLTSKASSTRSMFDRCERNFEAHRTLKEHVGRGQCFKLSDFPRQCYSIDDCLKKFPGQDPKSKQCSKCGKNWALCVQLPRVLYVLLSLHNQVYSMQC